MCSTLVVQETWSIKLNNEGLCAALLYFLPSPTGKKVQHQWSKTRLTPCLSQRLFIALLADSNVLGGSARLRQVCPERGGGWWSPLPLLSRKASLSLERPCVVVHNTNLTHSSFMDQCWSVHDSCLVFYTSQSVFSWSHCVELLYHQGTQRRRLPIAILRHGVWKLRW